jgi:transposase
MSLGRTRDERKEQQWQRWIALWQSSGLSVAAFCARHGLASASFYAWRRTLQRRAAQPVPLLPVQLVPEQTLPASLPLEVVLADGRLVRVPVGFDAATLRQLLTLLQEEPPC